MNTEDSKFANLSPTQVERLRAFEQELRETTHQNLVLLAYEQSDATKGQENPR